MMKLLILCVMLSLASGSGSGLKRLALTVSMKGSSQISDKVLRSIPEVLPNLIISALPPVAKGLGSLLEEVSVDSVFKPDGVGFANVTLYFLSLPQSVAEIYKGSLQSIVSSASVMDVLKGLLPVFFACGDSCELDLLDFNLVNADTVPAPFEDPPHHAHTIGLSLFIVGATKAIDPDTITMAQAALPGLLANQLDRIVNPVLTSEVKKVMNGLLSRVTISQNLNATGLFFELGFPAVPSTYIELYQPALLKYVINNPVVSEWIKQYPAQLIGCDASCSIEDFKLVDVTTVVTTAPTTNAVTTNAPSTIAPSTSAPSTIAPSTSAPSTIAPSTIAPTASPVVTVIEASSASSFAPVNALFVVLGVIAIVL